MLGETPLTVTNSYKYMVYIVSHYLHDKAAFDDNESCLHKSYNALPRTLKTLDFFKRFTPHLHFFSNFQ